MKKLYVLAGKAKTGKDSAGNIIENYYKEKNQIVIKYSCTSYLKTYIKQIYGWDGNESTKPRDILQSLGYEIKEKYPNYFIDRMNEDIRFLSSKCDVMIITGIRLVKELEFLKNEFHGILVKIESKTIENNLTEKQKQDITEIDVDNFNEFDYIINNDKDIVSLKEKIINLIEEVDNER